MTNQSPKVRWTIDIAYKQKLTTEDAKFIFDQSEKLLNDSVQTSTIIAERVVAQLTVISTIMVALIAYFITQMEGNKAFTNLGIAALSGIVYFIALAIYTLQNIQPHAYYVSGSRPADLFREPFFHDSIPDNDRLIRYYVNEIENYQHRIEDNTARNVERWKKYKRTLLTLMLSPIVFILSYLLSEFIRCLL